MKFSGVACSRQHGMACVQVLEQSTRPVQAWFAHSPGLKRLGEWLGAPGEGTSLKLSARVLEVLAKLPIDTAALQGSGLGKCAPCACAPRPPSGQNL